MNESIRKMLESLRRDEEVLRSTRERMLPLERLRMDQQLIRDILPHYEASRKLAEISRVHEEHSALSRRAQEVLDSVATPGVIRGQQKVLALLAEQDRFRRSVLPYIGMTEALTHTYALAAKARQPAIEEALKGFDELQQTAVKAAEMRATVEAAVEKSQHSPAIHALVSGLGDLSNNSTAIWTSLAANSSELAEIPKQLLEAPVVQVFQATQSIGLLVALEPEIVEAAPPKGLI
ncbi:MAG TPA: hypothetical protein VFR81_08755, partial [Longimicrobium sp.]|nr:hypothetical protein [Longimicrobium sp.]